MELYELADLNRIFQQAAQRSTSPVRPSPFVPMRARSVFPRPTPKPITAYALLKRLAIAVKPKVFISYHHKGDQFWQYRFTQLFGDKYELFTDRSIYRLIGSDDPNYQSRKIREEHISGTSLTIVLIGANTWKRKHVDWEIHSTLAKRHGLLGIILPTCPSDRRGRFIVPDRFAENVNTGFATWIHWSRDPATVRRAIDLARQLAKNTESIDNSRSKMARNLA